MPRILRSAVVGVSYRAAAQALVSDPGFVLAEGRPSGSLSVDIGDLRVTREVRIEYQKPTGLEQPIPVVSVPLEVAASERAGWFPVLEGELELTRAGGSCELTLDAEYRVPGSVVGMLADRVLLHDAAESSVDDFFEGIVNRLRGRAQQVEATTGVPD